MYYVGAFPLGSSDVYCSDRAFFWHMDFDSSEVSFLSGRCYAGADIDAELHHLVTVLKKKFAKFRRVFPIFLRGGREIKRYH